MKIKSLHKQNRSEYDRIIGNKNLRNSQNYIYSKNKAYSFILIMNNKNILNDFLNIKKGEINFVKNSYITKFNNKVFEKLMFYFLFLPLMLLFIGSEILQKYQIYIIYMILILLLFPIIGLFFYLLELKKIKKSIKSESKKNNLIFIRDTKGLFYFFK